MDKATGSQREMGESPKRTKPRLEFAFAIPLMPRAAAADWNRVERNLRRTVESALRASRGHHAAVYVACHDEPDLGEFSRENLRVRSVPFARAGDAAVGMSDRANKRRFIGAWLREDLEDHGYVMFLDADDLVHRDVVGFALAQQAGSYVVDAGYLLDVDRGLLLRRRSGFYQTCGSSFVCRFGVDELPAAWDDDASPYSRFGSGAQQGHTEYPRIAAEQGKPAVAFPFPAAVYVVNHGDNHWTAVSGRNRRLSKAGDIVRPATARRVLVSDFAAGDFADRIAGGWVVARAFAGAVVRSARGRLARMRARRGS